MKLQISYPPSPIADMTLGSCTQDTLIHPASGTPGKGEAAFQGIFVLCIPATNYDSIIPFPNTYFSTFQNVTKKVSSNDMSGLTPLPLFLPLENSPMNWDWSGQVSIAKPSFPIAVWKHFNNAWWELRKSQKGWRSACVYVYICMYTVFYGFVDVDLLSLVEDLPPSIVLSQNLFVQKVTKSYFNSPRLYVGMLSSPSSSGQVFGLHHSHPVRSGTWAWLPSVKSWLKVKNAIKNLKATAPQAHNEMRLKS